MYQFASIEGDFLLKASSSSQDFYVDKCLASGVPQEENFKRTLREKNGYPHVPHSEKSPQIVAKRNARERRRVQAVNNAFVKLRNVIPIQNTRGKRISKVKTLLYAIDYIRALDDMLHDLASYNMIYCELPEGEIRQAANWV
ncbi:hypothetical protein HUJ04_009479 [Dendroctonus ponderosae]|uniref:BHLH domain-containing protein n=1 Tax=Dendroctonus ponderosae TaxID=77166 RepID=A0AAR5PYD0_DENPD|nr:hypothetical protein HUJ04_009479 [Dendroctonus ponderosae]KAH1026779.1 hypothetical protein HUJ05_000397 [Dendroctonus ponderosae]